MKAGASHLPPWFRQRITARDRTEKVLDALENFRVNTVCESAQCPNRTSCYASRTATFMILGRICTRDCAFCAVKGGVPGPPDAEEPRRIAQAVKALGMKYTVITSVTRDDLPDGGAGHFAGTVSAVKGLNPGTAVELLIPDLEDLTAILESGPEVIGHNIETVPRLYPSLRPRARYEKSLGVLQSAKERAPGTITKSGIMLGLGETIPEIEQAMADLREAGCDVLTMGQYLRPSRHHYPVKDYLYPELFTELSRKALEKGFRAAPAAPLVRSSFRALETFSELGNDPR